MELKHLSKYKTFINEDLVEDLGIPKSDEIEGLVENHEKCIEILKSIQKLNRRKNSTKDNIGGFGGTFPELKAKYIHRIGILEKSIERLYQRYDKIIKNFNK